MSKPIPGCYLSAQGDEALLSMAPDDWREYNIHLNTGPDVTTVCAHLLGAVRTEVLTAIESGAVVGQALLEGDACHVIIAGSIVVLQPVIDLCCGLWASTSGRLIFAQLPSGLVECDYKLSIPRTWGTIILKMDGARERDIYQLMSRIQATGHRLALLRGGSTRALVGEIGVLESANRLIAKLGGER